MLNKCLSSNIVSLKNFNEFIFRVNKIISRFHLRVSAFRFENNIRPCHIEAPLEWLAEITDFEAIRPTYI
jgi:hypothetical protein